MWNPGSYLRILPITTRKIDFVCAGQNCSQEGEKEVGGGLVWALTAPGARRRPAATRRGSLLRALLVGATVDVAF